MPNDNKAQYVHEDRLCVYILINAHVVIISANHRPGQSSELSESHHENHQELQFWMDWQALSQWHDLWPPVHHSHPTEKKLRD